MKNSEIFKIINRLGMLDRDSDPVLCEDAENATTPEDDFEETCRSLPRLIDFVNDLFIYNDQTMIKELLICILHDNN